MTDSTLQVTFVDANTNRVLYQSSIPLDQLPDTFAIETTVQVDGKEYLVAAADPIRRDQAAERGGLTLHILETIEADDQPILYSLPTIESSLPAMGDVAVDGTECMLHEDSWRQVEFVDPQFAPIVDAVFQKIEAIREQAKTLVVQGTEMRGFESCHIRSELPEPLGSKPRSFSKFVQAIGAPDRKDLAIEGCENRIRGGFALQAEDGIWWYGVEENDNLKALCLATEGGVIAITGLVVVDWCNCWKSLPE